MDLHVTHVGLGHAEEFTLALPRKYPIAAVALARKATEMAMTATRAAPRLGNGIAYYGR